MYKYLKTSGESNNFNQGLSEKSEDVLIKLIDNSVINEYKNEYEKKAKSHPSVNRWMWHAIIVISGTFISILLFDGLIIGIIYYIIFMICILNDYFKAPLNCE